MIFFVVWTQAALNELADLWVRGDSILRKQITAAANAIDEELKLKPDEKGESRGNDDRVFFVYPLGVQFDIDHSRSTVRVFHLWDIRRKT